MKRNGANFRDQRTIQQMHAAGKTLEEISNATNVKPEVCANFMEHLDDGGEIHRGSSLPPDHERTEADAAKTDPEPEQGNPPEEEKAPAKQPAAKK